MNRTARSKATRHGFTLIEMIGVLAIIVILAAVLIPRVIESITDSRVANVVTSVNTVEAAVIDFLGNPANTLPAANAAFDTALVTAGSLASPLVVPQAVIAGPPVGTDTAGTVAAVQTAAGVTAGTNFNLDGATAAGNIGAGATIVRVVLTNVPQLYALRINNAIDGALAAPALGALSNTGRVSYIAAAGGIHPNVFIYVTHVNAQ